MGPDRGSGPAVRLGDASDLRKGQCPGAGRVGGGSYQSVWGHLRPASGADTELDFEG